MSSAFKSFESLTDSFSIVPKQEYTQFWNQFLLDMCEAKPFQQQPLIIFIARDDRYSELLKQIIISNHRDVEHVPLIRNFYGDGVCA